MTKARFLLENGGPTLGISESRLKVIFSVPDLIMSFACSEAVNESKFEREERKGERGGGGENSKVPITRENRGFTLYPRLLK